MKKLVVLLFTTLFIASGCQSNNKNQEEATTMTNSNTETKSSIENSGKVLVAYFSRAGENYNVGIVEKGSTEIVAEQIASEMSADLFKIESVNPYPEDYDETKEIVQKEYDENARPELKTTIPDLDSYDTIFIGFPIWHGDMPMPVYTFLEKVDFSDKVIVPFSTNEGTGIANATSVIKETVKPKSMREGFAITGKQVQDTKGKSIEGVSQWLNKIFLNQNESVSQNMNRNTAIDLYKKHNEYMVNKETNKLTGILDDDFTLTHMTGKKQTKKEWLEAIDEEEMRYFSSNEELIDVKVDGNQMILVGQSQVDASIYGSRNTWPLELTLTIGNVDEEWKIMNVVASTY